MLVSANLRGCVMLFFEKVKAIVTQAPALAVNKEKDPAELELKISCISVLLEAALSDEHFDELEKEVILSGIEREFGVGADDARQLLSEALEQRDPRPSLSASLEQLSDRYNPKQRKRILGLVRQVIEADQIINEFEMSVYTYISEKLG
jgi:uncharacterized tellurite resistance protein B-like protein